MRAIEPSAHFKGLFTNAIFTNRLLIDHPIYMAKTKKIRVIPHLMRDLISRNESGPKGRPNKILASANMTGFLNVQLQMHVGY
jgi:hypothetical protein